MGRRDRKRAPSGDPMRWGGPAGQSMGLAALQAELALVAVGRIGELEAEIAALRAGTARGPDGSPLSREERRARVRSARAEIREISEQVGTLARMGGGPPS